MTKLTDFRNSITINDLNDPAINIKFKPKSSPKDKNEAEKVQTTFNLSSIFSSAQILDLLQKPEVYIEFTGATASDKHLKLRTLVLKNSQSLRESNIQLLHLGTGIVKYFDKSSKEEVFAPLIIAPIEVKTDKKGYLVKIGKTFFNEKALALLKKYQPYFELSPVETDSIFEYIKKSSLWNTEELSSKVNPPKSEECINKIVPVNGSIISLFNPLGNYVVQKLKSLENNEEITSNILNVKGNLFAFKQIQKINRHLDAEGSEIWKVIETNLSQDKAIISALKYHTIIWGAPGTGKTQTLTNLIINILLRNKTALISSQKPIALEVLYKRLGSANNFALFLSKENLKPQNFYKKINEAILTIEKIPNFQAPQLQPAGILSNEEKDYLSNKKIQEINEKIATLKETFSAAQWEFFNKHPKLNFSNNYSQFKKSNTLSKDQFNQLISLFNAQQYDQIQTTSKEIKDLETKKITINLKYPNPNKTLNSLKEISFFKIFQIAHFLDNISSSENSEADPYAIDEETSSTPTFSNIKITEKDIEDFTFDIRSKTLSPLQFLQKHKEMIKLLFPIIMATPDVNLSTYQNGEFDYVIIDEASQMTYSTGISILVLGKIHILSGDEKQLQPLEFFKKSLESELSLEDAPQSAIKSILDYGLAKKPIKIQLDKNYRSKSADLMTFNSTQFYENKLDIMDQFFYGKTKSVFVQHIPNADYIDGINTKEIHQTIFNLNQQIKTDPTKTIIVITTNANQQEALEKELLRNHPLLFSMLTDGQINIKNLANIQGEEADVVIFSVGYTKNTKFNLTFVGRPGGSNALNVATSRAKEKLIVIKSLYDTDVVSNTMTEELEIFKQWLKFLDLEDYQKRSYRITKTLLEEPDKHNENFFKIKQELINKIQPILASNDIFKTIKIKEDHYISTLKTDLVLIDELRQIPICIFLINEDREIINYLQKRDIANYLNFKNYNYIVVSPSPQYETILEQTQKFLNEWIENHEYVPPVLKNQKTQKTGQINEIESLIDFGAEPNPSETIYIQQNDQQQPTTITKTKYKYIENNHHPVQNSTEILENEQIIFNGTPEEFIDIQNQMSNSNQSHLQDDHIFKTINVVPDISSKEEKSSSSISDSNISSSEQSQTDEIELPVEENQLNDVSLTDTENYSLEPNSQETTDPLKETEEEPEIQSQNIPNLEDYQDKALIREKYENPKVHQENIVVDNRSQNLAQELAKQKEEQKKLSKSKKGFFATLFGFFGSNKKSKKPKPPLPSSLINPSVNKQPTTSSKKSFQQLLATSTQAYQQIHINQDVKTKFNVFLNQDNAKAFWYIDVSQKKPNSDNTWITMDNRYFLTDIDLWYKFNQKIYFLLYNQLESTAPNLDEAQKSLPYLKKYIVKYIWNQTLQQGKLPQFLSFINYSLIAQLLDEEKLHFEVIEEQIKKEIAKIDYKTFIDEILNQFIEDKNTFVQSVFNSKEYYKNSLPNQVWTPEFNEFTEKFLNFVQTTPDQKNLLHYLEEFKQIKKEWFDNFLKD